MYLRYSESYKSFVVELPGAAFVVSSNYHRFERVAASVAKNQMAAMARLGR
jgi:hypothetical protein